MKLPFILLLILGFAPVQSDQTVFLDDIGMNAPLLSEIMQVLDSHEVDVIHFVIPSRLDNGTAELLSGRKIGVHGYAHFCGEFNVSHETAYSLLEKGMSNFSAFDLSPTYFRPPCDLISPDARRAVDDFNLTFISGAPDYILTCKNCSLEKEIASLNLWVGGNISFHQNAFLGPGRHKLKIMDEILCFFDR